MTSLLSFLTGIAYTALGIISLSELVLHRRDRGFSHFALAFGLMAFTCGPHHLMHAFRHEHHHGGPLLIALALGMAPALVFIGLRLEAAFGGRGDRLILGTPVWLSLVPMVMAAVGGATVSEALRGAVAGPAAVLPNAILFVNYALVGFFTARTQLARRPLLGGWSLSGVAMSGVFLTCAVSHLVAGLLTPPGVLDLIGAPWSFYFLWAVHRLHRDSARDWNRRPLVGRPAPRGRRSPWAEHSA
jgi:hypothetical protein